MEKLRQVLAQEDTVLFIGSGISMWSGLPSWSGVIEELALFLESSGAKADLVRSEAQKGDLLQAASYGFDKLTKQQIGDFIRYACRYGVAKPHEIHQKIVTLGPRCFITTNYDNLIEESLRQWQPDRFFRPPVTNRHLTETAEIVHARAIDFIFKPHGDAADSESIILTREQYRQLLPQGERQAALESLKMLLASRPVVYLGFGLRDPDFIYVRDLLANTYKGGTRDHYAIVADVSDEESDYWRRNYGIHLVSYSTNERPDKTKDHNELLILLEKLLIKTPELQAPVCFDPCCPEVVLTLARHAAVLARSPKISPEISIRVHAETKKRGSGDIRYTSEKFDHSPVEKFLDDGPEHTILVGLPGAGKTYSLRRAAVRLAEKLNEACLSEPFDEKSVVVPILVDLKLYRGDICELVSQMLPKSLPFDELIRCFKVKIFLDSFNEMPREYWENGSYESDIEKFIKGIGRASLVIGSRTSDGLDKLGLPVYCLDQIDDEAISAALLRLGIEIEGRFNREVRWLLQRPFYFQYVANGVVKLPKEAHPRDFYQLFFENVCKTFTIRFGKQLDLENALSLTAYDALNRGEEVFSLSELLRVLKTSIQSAGLDDIDARDIANWLVSSSVLIPHTGGRVAFVHQSVTEYLAASELARRYQATPYILKEKLTLTRWDQALFLTLSLLLPEQADKFLQDVTKADFVLALNAVKYLEIGRDEVVSKLLSEIPNQIQTAGRFEHKIESALRYSLPVTDVHEPQIKMLIKYGNSLGAAAVIRLVELKGIEVKDEMLQLLFENHKDFNFCFNGVARALSPFATNEDALKIAAWADSIQVNTTLDSDDKYDGFASGAARFLAELDLSVIRRDILPLEKLTELPEIRTEIVCDILKDVHTTDSLNFAGELLLRGVRAASITIYFILRFSKSESEVSLDSFTTAHVDQLLSILDQADENWSIDALKCICDVRSDLAEVVKKEASKKAGIEKAALLYCASSADLTPGFQALGDLIAMSDEELKNQPFRILKRIEFDWAGKEVLFVQLLKLRNKQLASALFGGSSPPTVLNLGNLEIGPIEWWLEWMMEVNSTDDGYWFCFQFGALFGEHLNKKVQDEFTAEFNKTSSKFRRLLMKTILPTCKNITTEVFSEDSISFLLADLSREGGINYFHGHLLGDAATEQFVTEHLLPLLPNAKQPLLNNIHEVLRQAGSRHGRRYLFD